MTDTPGICEISFFKNDERPRSYTKIGGCSGYRALIDPRKLRSDGKNLFDEEVMIAFDKGMVCLLLDNWCIRISIPYSIN